MQALLAFEAAARLRSLSRAAESLYLTHGAVSHQIKRLEAELGVHLIERAGRGIRLTDEGEQFATRVRAALAELLAAMRQAKDRGNPRQWRVSVMPSFAARWLLPRIGRFMALHADIDLDVRASTALADFRHDDVDVGIRYGRGNYPGTITEHLLDDAYFPVCSPRIAGGVPSKPSDLARYTLLRSEDEFWQPWFEAAGLDWREPTRGPMFNDTSHVLQAAAEGQGIALARSSLIGNDLSNGVLVRPFELAVPSELQYFLVYPPRLADSPKLALFRSWLRDEIASDANVSVALARTNAAPRKRRASVGTVPKARKRRAQTKQGRG